MAFSRGVFIDNPQFPELKPEAPGAFREVWRFQVCLGCGVDPPSPAKIQTIVGTTNRERLADICTAGDIQLSREDWYQIYLTAGNQLP